jgi:hypothetical protein
VAGRAIDLSCAEQILEAVERASPMVARLSGRSLRRSGSVKAQAIHRSPTRLHSIKQERHVGTTLVRVDAVGVTCQRDHGRTHGEREDEGQGL